MKKIIIFFILTAYLLPQASAQQVKFGVEAGGNWSHYKNDKSKAEQVGSMGGGFQLGGTVDYEFKHHWMLMSGLYLDANPKQYGAVQCQRALLPRYGNKDEPLEHPHKNRLQHPYQQKPQPDTLHRCLRLHQLQCR